MLSSVNALLGRGSMGQRLRAFKGDIGCLRPYMELDTKGNETGRTFVTVNTGDIDKEGNAVTQDVMVNTHALLTREQWQLIDEGVMWAQKLRLQLWNLIYGALPLNIANGWARLGIRNTTGDVDADAVLSMDGMRRSERSQPIYDVNFLPFPVTHSDNSMSARHIAITENSGGVDALDLTNVRAMTRKVNEVTEQLTLGTYPTYTFDGGTIYGFRNYPNRVTKIITSPLTGGYTQVTTYNQVLAMIQALEDIQFYGPYALLISTGWGQYFDQDYNQTFPTTATLRSKIQSLEKIRTVQTVDYMPDYEMILFQIDPEVVQAVQFMPLAPIQWEDPSGMEAFIKVITGRVPRLRSNFRGQTGILHATATLGGTTTSTTTTTTTT